MLTDAVLVDRVIVGFDDAFEELYRRHSGAAWRLAQAVTGNAHDAADAVSEAFARVLQAVRNGRLDEPAAFRAYLLTATRNAGLDALRRAGKDRPTDDADLDVVSLAPTPAESAATTADAVLVAQAFRKLPERWRSVLWLTEVEGVTTKDAADQLGMTANGTAQLAVRARAGLRERYLQAHVRNHARPECRFTVERLGAYVGGAISPRDLAKLDQHLADCADCQARKDELAELGSSLRRVVVPIPIALGALSARKVHAVLSASSVTAPAGLSARAVQLAKQPTPFMQKAVAASAAGVLALGLLAIGLVDDDDDDGAGLAAPRNTSADAVTAELPDPVIDPLATRFFGRSVRSAPATRSSGASSVPPPAAAVAAPAPAAPEPLAVTKPPVPQTRPDISSPLPDEVCTLPVVEGLCGGTPSDDSPLPDVEVPVPVPDVEIGANLADQEAGVALSTDEGLDVGVVAGPIAVGEPAPSTPDEQGVEVSVAGDEVLSLP